MNKYTELKDRHAKELNAFPMGFAFSDKQFEEAKEKLGVKSNDELLRVYGGGFIRKTDKDWYNGLCVRWANEQIRAEQDDEYLYQAFLYELANHEYGITYDKEPTLDSLGISLENFDKDERKQRVFKEARAKYLDGFVY